MGFDQSNTQDMTKGIGLVGDLFDFFGQSGGDTVVDTSGEAEESARIMELDARQQAMVVADQNKEQADAVHAETERARAKRNARGGASNIAMSGSRKLVNESRELSERHDEEDGLVDGEREVSRILSKGKRKANLYRISGGLAPTRTILTLGSSIYDKE